ncbi:flagellar basal body rod C-terminal domain-containing protein [Nautilia sp. PV-1]|uniref:flagellar basal body rod C-terminal domain-containing protein n=1 Tax=Nautilia sp. PV-1 TaxID=2579250 RepID=UPI000FDAEDE6|nr:flagellar basal body rod C-terminal domain-containing protein [Nautilia sp. PV-1]
MINTNLNSLQAHQTLMDINANNVANVNTEDFKATNAHIVDRLEISADTSQSGTDLTKELTDQIVIEDGFKAQIPAIKTQDEMTKTLLDIKA